MRSFVSPHVHIQSLDSASTPESFVKREIELGTGAITCTDHGFVGTIPKVYELAKKNNLIPILGVEAYMRDDDCSILSESGIVKVDDPKYIEAVQSGDAARIAKAVPTTSFYRKYFHFCLHCKNQTAYEALVKEMSWSFLNRAEKHGGEEKPIFTWEQIERLGQFDITMTSGCLIGMVQGHLMQGRPDIARRYYERLRAAVKPGNFYVEVFPHRCTHYWDQGVYLTLEDGRKLRYFPSKTLLVETTKGKEPLKLKAIELVHVWKNLTKDGGRVKLADTMRYRKWEGTVEPGFITELQSVEDFVPNECTPDHPDGDVQLPANRFVMELAKKYGDPIIISDDAHFTAPEEKIVQDSKLTSGDHTWKFHNSYHRMGGNEAYEYFHGAMGTTEAEFESWVDNSYAFREGFKDFKFKHQVQLLTKPFPTDTLGYLKKLIEKHGRMDKNDPAMMARLKQEIQLLHRNGTVDLLPYFFLAEWAIDEPYTQQGKLTGVGRGSSGGVLIDYLLAITHMNPLEYDLSLDRFITPDRIASGKYPDIDMDFPERDTLMDTETGWLIKTFGDKAAAISTRTGLRLKSSIKDVMRSKHGYVSPEVEAWVKKIGNPPQGINDKDFVFGYVSDDGKEVRGLLEESLELQTFVKNYPTEWETVRQMLGITRGHSRHASGWVLADQPIGNFLPVFKISGITTTQYDMTGVEAHGGLKMDFLGLKNLLYLQDAIKLVQKRHGGGLRTEAMTIDRIKVWPHQQVLSNGQWYFIWKLPHDKAVFRDVCEGATETVFQLSTPSAKKWLREFNTWRDQAQGLKAIASIEDIANFTSLDRPGPLDAYVTNPKTGERHNMLQEYARRAAGQEPTGEVKALTALLPTTFGVLVTQEGLEKVYRELTGCSGAEATEFRSNIAKKKMKKVEGAFTGFMERAVPKIGQDEARQVWDQLVTFGQYGFNKSHAVAYAITAYACAWFKRNYNLEWWTSVLMNSDKDVILEKFWEYCRHLLSPPNIRYSGRTFEIGGDKIVMPINFIKGVGPGATEELQAGAPYVDIEDFCRKVAAHRKANAKPAFKKTGEAILDKKTGIQKMRLGTTALNGGIVKRLIVAGIMDSLFPDDIPLFEKINTYERLTTENGGAKKKADYFFINLNAMQRHQLKREYMPIGKDTMLGIVLSSRAVQGFYKGDQGKVWLRPQGDMAKQLDAGGMDFGAKGIQIIDDTQLKLFNQIPWGTGMGRMTIGAFLYVGSSSVFEIKRTGKSANKFRVDGGPGGEEIEVVQWSGRRTKVPSQPPPPKGSIIFAVLSRYGEKPAAAELYYVVSPPVERKKQDAEESAEGDADVKREDEAASPESTNGTSAGDATAGSDGGQGADPAGKVADDNQSPA